ncbi:MAG: AAA family ATPase [Dehalococcoidales bacterium]|nr:AAA family ATPase [Dehalococcoidales bacterium]
MHCISEITAHNFRSCIHATFPLSEFTPLVGYNNGGKSNILTSIRWLLRPYSLSAIDFNDPQSPVIVASTITGITPELLDKLAETHRNRVRNFCTDGTLGIRRTQASPGQPVNSIVLEVRNPSISDEDSENAWSRNPTGIDAAIKVLFPEPIEIGAMEDATEDIGKSKSGTTIGKLIAEIMEPIEQQHGTEIRQTLDGIRQRLEAEGAERAPELNQFDRGANDKLQDIFPGIAVRLHVPTPEFKALFKDGTIRVFEEGETVGRDINQVGHGAQRSIQMALVRYLAEMKVRGDAQDAARTLLLIDEPELYLHPQAIEQVRLALKTLARQGYQVIFATHSPQMIEKEDIGNTLIVCKTIEQGTHTRKRLTDAITEIVNDAPSQARILFELSNSSKILFSDRVLIAEGPTEEKLLPDIFHRIKGYALSTRKIALVSLGGSGNTAKGLRILDAIGIPAKALVDLDYAFRTATKAEFLSNDDADIAGCCRVCSEVSAQCGFALAEDGFPKRSESMSASDAFALLATLDEARVYISNLHDKLKEQSIWLWKKGTIEDHLGIDKKGESAWADCAQNIQQNGCEQTIADYHGIVDLLNWVDSD